MKGIRFLYSIVTVVGLPFTLCLLGCSRSEPEPTAPYFVLHKEFHTVSQRTDKQGVPTERTTKKGKKKGLRDKPGEAVAIFDANMDGLQDIVVVNGSQNYFVMLNSKDGQGQHEFGVHGLTIGPKDDGLRHISKALGLHDFNNDGALDLHLCVLGKGTARTAWKPNDAGLLRSGGFCTQVSRRDGSFVYEDFGVNGLGSKRSAVFEDFDGDGHFDAYISTSPYYGPWYSGSPAPCQLYPGTGKNRAFGPDVIGEMLANAPPDFWKDEAGNGKINFKSVVIRDFDNDGQPDIAAGAIADILAYPYPEKTSPDDGPSYQGDWYRGVFIFRNISTPGRIHFDDVSRSAISNAYGKTNQMHLYSVVPADLNGDGRLDLIVAGPRSVTMSKSLKYNTDTFRIYRNDSTPGNIKFTDTTEDAGLAFLNYSRTEKYQHLMRSDDGMIEYRHADLSTIVAIDIDNDADVDIFATSPYAMLENPPPGVSAVRATGWVFLNDGAGKFTFVRPSAHGLHVLAKDLSYGDLNNDGRVDLVTVRIANGPAVAGNDSVFFNNIENKNNFIKINVTTDSNKLGIGTKVTVYKSGTEKILGYDEVRTDFRYRSKKSTTLHFGLGKVKKVDVKLVLRDGLSVIRKGLPANTEQTLSFQ